MKQSQIAVLKIGLMKSGVAGTSRLDDRKVLDLALSYGLISERDHVTAIAEQPTVEPATATPRARRAPVTLEQPTVETTPTPTATPAKDPQTLTTAHATDEQAALLAKLMQTLQPTSAPLDEARIIELINEHSPVKRVHVALNEQPAKPVEGITHYAFEEILAYMSCGLQLYLYGRSGAGKSHTAGQVAEALELEFFAQGSILAKFEALGSLTATGYNPSVIRNWLDSDGGLLCIDEIDASDPRALVTIMSIFDNDGQITFPDGVTCKRDPAKHFLIVTANTAGNGASAAYNGRMRLDGAIKARFVYVEHDYDEQIENSFAPQKTVDWLRRYRESVAKLGMEGSQVTPRHIKMAGLVAANKNIDRDQQRTMIENIAKQALTSTQHEAVLGGMK